MDSGGGGGTITVDHGFCAYNVLLFSYLPDRPYLGWKQCSCDEWSLLSGARTGNLFSVFRITNGVRWLEWRVRWLEWSEMTGVEGEMTGVESEMTGVESEMTGVESEMTGVESSVLGFYQHIWNQNPKPELVPSSSSSSPSSTSHFLHWLQTSITQSFVKLEHFLRPFLKTRSQDGSAHTFRSSLQFLEVPLKGALQKWFFGIF